MKWLDQTSYLEILQKNIKDMENTGWPQFIFLVLLLLF
jgi:hypothetical protein